MGFMDYGQGANAFATNFLNASNSIQSNDRANQEMQMKLQLQQAQLAEAERQAQAEQALARLTVPTTHQLFKDQPEDMSGNPPQLSAIGQGLMGKMTQGIPQQIPQDIMNSANEGGAPYQQFSGTQNVQNPDYAQAQQKAMADLMSKGSITVPANPSLMDMVNTIQNPNQRVLAMIKLKGAESKGVVSQSDLVKSGKYTIDSIVDYLKTGDLSKLELTEKTDKNATKYNDFAIGYAAKLKAENPNMTDAEIKLATSKEADRLGMDKAVTTIINKTEAVNAINAKEGFQSWSPEAKQQAFVEHMLTDKPPVSAGGMGSNNRKAYDKEYQQWKVDNNFSPRDVALMKADYKAGSLSLNNMSKQEAPMSAFVLNINKQIEKVKQLYDNDDRIGIRMLDVPLRELRVKALGSGAEAVKASYLLEISNEIGKLSSGASGSVQQLSDSAKEDWKKVHDVNLSMKDIMQIVNATRDQANMRMSTWRQAKEEVRSQIKNVGIPSVPEAQPFNVTIPGGIDPQAIANELAKRLKRR